MVKLAPLALGLCILALAACGSSSPSSTTTNTTTTAAAPASSPAGGSSSATSSLSLEANPEGQLKYNTSSLTAKAGRVSITMANMSPLGHNVTIESSSKQILGATPTFQGGTHTLTLDLKPGVYKFFCSVPGHRMAGMEGTLTVK